MSRKLLSKLSISRVNLGPLLVSVLVLASLSSLAAAQSRPVQVGEDAQQEMSLTVYNNNFAVVREVREVVLPKGRVELEYQDVARDIDPTSVTVGVAGVGHGFTVLEQNYRYDLLSRDALLSRFINQKLKYTRTVLQGSQYETIYREGNLLAINPEIVDFGDEIEIAPTGTISLNAIPEDLKSIPTLVWLIDSATSGTQQIETSYITGNIQWHADYIFVLDAKKSNFDLSAWVSLDNRSGSRYQNTTLKLVAGQVNRVADRRPEMERDVMLMRSDSKTPQVQALFDYHLYTMPHKTTLANNEIKQLRLMEADGVNYVKRYQLDSQVQNYQFADAQKSNFDILIEFANAKSNGLGGPLPAGKVRVYQRDSDKVLQLVGEDRMRHLPRDETAVLQIGKAFDLIAERRQTSFKRLGERVIEIGYEIAVRNQKSEKAQVILNERMFGDWQVTQENMKGRKIDSMTQAYLIELDEGATSVLKYTIRVGF
ncbi:MAG: hypothetical protein ACJAWG_002029 [Candidatus Azotimanducaceae bacterium]|jgi:hypothetical protein